MRYGFLMDQTKCIGCHACTVACKAEHDIPLGDFRTWVTYTETGTFPNAQRHFQVNRCNQCEDAPCVTICPTQALFFRPDGIVDFDSARCIGCKACMAACPYDAIYIDQESHTAAKCNFCAHRVDNGMLPACAVVCPEQAIITGDLDDPESLIARLVATEPVSVRKPEQGTKPKVFYLGADASTLDPTRTLPAQTYITASRRESVPVAFDPTPPAGTARKIYDTPHVRAPWGPMVSLYLWTKSLAAGIGGVTALLALLRAAGAGGGTTGAAPAWAAGGALLFLLATVVLLVGDLKRPERFLLMFVRPHWSSWLVKGGVLLTLYGAALGVWLAARLAGRELPWPFWLLLLALAIGSAGYSAFLFGQAEARDHWQSPLVFWHLLTQAAVAGTAALFVAVGAGRGRGLGIGLALAVVVHVLLALAELARRHETREAALSALAVRRGAFARLFWLAAMALGGLGAVGGVWLAIALQSGVIGLCAAAGALCGLLAYEHVWVRAGQSVALS